MNQKNKQSAFSSTIIFILSGVIALVIACVGYLFYKASLFTQLLDQPIPYVPDEKLDSVLRRYTEEEKHKEILLIYGPPGVGKTRGILEFSQKYRKEGNLVIDFDLITYSNYATEKDLIDHICTAIIQAFREIDGTPFKAAALKDILDRVASTTSFIATNKIGKHYFLGLIRDPLLQRAASYLISAVETSTEKGANLKAATLYEALETLNEALHSLIVIHEPYKLYQTEDCKNYCVETTQFFSKLFASSERAFTTGVVFDVANQTKLPLFHKQGIRFVRVLEFSQETGSNALYNIFRAPQFKTIYQTFGGIGLYFARVNELLLSGYTLIEAQKLLLDDIKYKVTKVINTAEDQKAMKEVLKTLVQKDPKNSNAPDKIRESLLAEGLFYYSNDSLDTLMPSSTAVVTAITDVLKISKKTAAKAK
ncbi:hypothetical protein TVAG_112100 [Trichomonas vaginalis G3]|uniref:ATPase domain-containing protein n=1 Tax=Trichomonas vaginalis (strain ATCC PRA-98 / G3) TaxID=412133 RepID=A2G3Y4_TRIV3|nr:P-loop containing nucleoside triphosphate hydrolases family [Trichomonas vaginalis G3]EAX88129.1 hypothetical protein TVAG_112100 [Trichomonas vaginalis G3]KAI5501335.1 P-loop containing nucleoside triphosphate hydrolases family [Trichomonas vaginalis G3]|eukprot:XP_001301059.1 hypothetical protein [Trichomonas vaginalis G3]